MTRKFVFSAALLVAAAACTDRRSAEPTAPGAVRSGEIANEGQSGTTLTAFKWATGHSTKTFAWTINKTAAPAVLNLFRGDEGASQYTIAVTKDAGTVRHWVTDSICVTNGGAVATEGLLIIDELRYPTAKDAPIMASMVFRSRDMRLPGGFAVAASEGIVTP